MNHRTAAEGEGIPLTPHYHFQPLHRHLDIILAGQLLQRDHLCTKLADRLEPRTLGFQVQVANH